MAISTLSLLDCCLPVIVYLSWLTEGDREQEADQVRTRFEILFRDLDAQAQAMGYNQEEVRFTMFALVAAIDERLMLHDWPGRKDWFREPLQLVFFNTNAVGEEFYQRLEQVQQRMSEGVLRADVLEVYHAMLATGLQGQLGATLALRKQRDDLIAELSKQLAQLRPRDAELSGENEMHSVGNILRRKIWLPPVLVAGILFVCICGLWLWLSSGSSDAVSVIVGGN